MCIRDSIIGADRRFRKVGLNIDPHRKRLDLSVFQAHQFFELAHVETAKPIFAGANDVFGEA